MKYYLDTEFDGFGGPLISLALVREDGYSLYLIYRELALEKWVADNVLPILRSVPGKVYPLVVDHATGARCIAEYFGGDVPDIITDWPDDVRYLCHAIITGPGQMAKIDGLRFDIRRVDAYPSTLSGAIQHNAWWDAMALRHLLTVHP